MPRPPIPLQWQFKGACIECTSHRLNQNGYARIKRGGITLQIANEIAKRFRGLTRGLCARHTCDNAWCINPAHIVAGTWADNNRDRAQRGRSYIGKLGGICRTPEGHRQYKSQYYRANRTRLLAGMKARYLSRKITNA